MNNPLQTIVKGLVIAGVKNRANFINVKRKLSNKEKIPSPLNSDLLRVYQQLLKKKSIKKDINLERIFRKREIRTLSGVAVITVITKPYPCPGKCIYCPGQKGMPKSYLSNEPAVMRAVGAKFDPFKQVNVRLKALKINGHETDKIELIVLGGSWSAYEKKYQEYFIKRCFDALNGKTTKNLKLAQKLNETAKHRCVGLTLETRPDMITPKELKRMRMLGCTRVELGVQSIYDDVLKLNKRGHDIKQTIAATSLLKQAGLKVMYHMMPNLPGSSLAKDLKMFQELFSNPNFQPDLLKIYPCVVTKDSVLYKWYKRGKFKAYTDNQLKKLLIDIKKSLPYYVRVTRLIRDIPAESIVAGNKITNLRQLIAEKYKGCKCIRCREAGHREELRIKNPASTKASAGRQELRLIIYKYKASGGTEYFLSYESPDRKILYAFLRLRIPSFCHSEFISESRIYQVFPELKGAALIRELHTYGQLIPLGKSGKIQHAGMGKKLMAEAEKIAKKQGFKKIAVISGIGVRQYYQKLGYRLEGTYMTKKLRQVN